MSFKKILVINTFGIGDVLFTTPLIKNIKLNLPQIFIGYIANRRTAPLLEKNPCIDRVYVYERDEHHALWKKSKRQFFREFWRFFSMIRRERYDAVIDLSLQSFFSFAACFSGIPRRFGFNYKNRSPWLTHKIFLEAYERKHVVQYYLDILTVLGLEIRTANLELSIDEKARRWAGEFLTRHFPSGQTVIAVAPGGGASWGKEARYKQWAAEKYAELADKIIEKFSVVVILVGDQTDQELCAHVARLMRRPVVIGAGETDLQQCAALLSRCAFVILNDGGLLHVAVAAGAKTLSIFGPVDEKVYGPYPGDGHTIVTHPALCRPCYRQFRRAQCEHVSCLTGIEVNDVFSAVERIMNKK